MCTVSMIGDFYKDKYKHNPPTQWGRTITTSDPVVLAQITELRKEVADMKELLKRALEYDMKNNQPHCENDEKIAFLRKIAESVGLTLDDIFPNKSEEPTPPPSRLVREHVASKKRK